MDALAVLLIGRLGVDVVLQDDGHILMAAGAGHRDVAAVDRGIRVVDRLDVMTAVAIPTSGRVEDASLEIGPAVDAVGIGRRAPAGPRIRRLPMAR
jgi:hypothetical protein